jgi:hypothetical protein
LALTLDVPMVLGEAVTKNLVPVGGGVGWETTGGVWECVSVSVSERDRERRGERERRHDRRSAGCGTRERAQRKNP